MSTFYLKYRPQTLEQLDLDSVREQLTNLLQSNSIPHAFLFSGPRGLGKTSSARILAKAINCENQGLGVRGQGLAKKEEKPASKSLNPKPSTLNPVPEPCNHCDACISITNGTAIDVIEIDGASNRGIDDIRTLKEGILQQPVQLTKKIYIIDEVHMLTKEAFNALLKTLEEPPEHVIFIFATTEPHKVPATILSRTFHIPFTKPTHTETKRALMRVIEGEKLKVDSTVLDRIIQRTDGGFRDSHKLLEQLALSNKPITTDNFETLFPQAPVREWLQAMVEYKADQAFAWIQTQQDRGIEWPEAHKEILLILKEQLLSFYGLGVTLWPSLDQSQTRTLIEFCLRASTQQKLSPVPTLPLELVVADWMEGVKTKEAKQILSENNQSSITNNQTNVKTKNNNKIKGNKDKDNNKIREQREEITKEKFPIINEALYTKYQIPITENSLQATSHKSQILTITIDQLSNKWEDCIKSVQTLNHSVAALLRSAQPYQIDKDMIIIKVFYEFHKGRLEQEKNREILQEAFQSIVGMKPKIKYILGEKGEQEQRQVDDDQNLAKMAEELFT